MNSYIESYSIHQNSFNFAKFTQNRTSSSPLANMVSVFIDCKGTEMIEIKIPDNLLCQLTSEWLLQETVKRIRAKEELQAGQARENGNIIALRTKSKSFAIDNLLSDPKSSLGFLKNRTVLEPYYCVDMRPLDEFGFKVELEDFEIETKLGQGAFSTVFLVRRKATGKLYALKQVRKGDLGRRRRRMLETERSLLIEMTSPFIVPLRWIFQTTSFCYFVLDFVPCGDLRHLISVKKRLNELEAKFYIAEVILALSTIHANSFLYRDLKPENILLTLDGHVQLTDFGLSKRVQNIKDLNYSRCGTEGLLAPEIVKDEGHNVLVDYYNIGTLAFELVTGVVPQFDYISNSFNKSCLENYNLSPDMQDFIARLLDSNPATRLGAKKGLTEITFHPWLQDLNMIDISKKNLRPPLKVDPNTIKFKVQKINYNIDVINDDVSEYGTTNVYFTNQTHEKALTNFSFYGFGDESNNLINCYRSPPSFTKIPTFNNIATAISPYASVKLQKAKTTTCISEIRTTSTNLSKFSSYKSIPGVKIDSTEEMSEDNDSVSCKVKKYTLKNAENQLEIKNLKGFGLKFTDLPRMKTSHI